MIIDAKLKWKFCLNKLHVGVINGFNCSSIANDKVFGNSESTSRSFSFFTKIVSNEEIFISDSVSIKINYDIFTCRFLKEIAILQKRENDELINAIKNNCNFSFRQFSSIYCTYCYFYKACAHFHQRV